MTPYLIIGGLVAAAGSFVYGMDVGEDRAIAKQKATSELVDAVYDKAQKGAASAIADMEVKNVTITQPIRTEVRTNTVYAECRHSPGGLRDLNAAITGRTEPAGGLKLPRTDATPLGR